MMREIPARVILIGAATVLGVAVVAGVAFAARGSLTVSDAPGQVLQVQGVGLKAGPVSPSATAQASPGAKGPVTATTSRATAQATSAPQSGVTQVAPPTAQMLPPHRGEVHSPGPAQSPSRR